MVPPLRFRCITIAAVDRQQRAGDEARRRRAQERPLRRRCRPARAQRPSGVRARIAALRAGSSRKRLRERRRHPARRDGVDANPVGRVRDRERLRELRDAALAGGIARHEAAAEEREHRRRVDDRAGRRLSFARARRAARIVPVRLIASTSSNTSRSCSAPRRRIAGAIDEDVEARQVAHQRPPSPSRRARRRPRHRGNEIPATRAPPCNPPPSRR